MCSPLLDISVDALGLVLNIDNDLVLLLDEHRHFVEHLRELGQGLFNLLDLGMTFLDFTVSATGSSVSVRVEELASQPCLVVLTYSL
jgi:hypothetical protein